MRKLISRSTTATLAATQNIWLELVFETDLLQSVVSDAVRKVDAGIRG